MTELYKDNKNKISWGRIYISSDDNKKVTIIWGATEDYLEDHNFSAKILSRKVEGKWKKISIDDSSFFDKNIHHDCYCSPENEEGFLEYLKKIKP